MLLHGVEVLQRASGNATAVPGFTAYNLETAQAICAVAESAGVPVILQAGASGFRYAGREHLARLALHAADACDGDVGVHLDHSRGLDEITACIELGYTSVMVDGSHLPFAENVALARAVVDRAHGSGVWVEAELGALAGDEDVSINAASNAKTDPAEAARFVEQTGVDALAVAVGNVHGLTDTPARLDIDRLQAIHQVCPVPLVLHGASGLPAGATTSPAYSSPAATPYTARPSTSPCSSRAALKRRRPSTEPYPGGPHHDRTAHHQTQRTTTSAHRRLRRPRGDGHADESPSRRLT